MRFAAAPGRFIELYRGLPDSISPRWIFIDEAQNVPELFDAVQYLYDEEKRTLPEERRTRFILCGSSARRLRRVGANLLPGRSFMHRLFPLTGVEYDRTIPEGYPIDRLVGQRSLLPCFQDEPAMRTPFPRRSLEDRMIFVARCRRIGEHRQLFGNRQGIGSFFSHDQGSLSASRGHVPRIFGARFFREPAKVRAFQPPVFFLRPRRPKRAGRAFPRAGYGTREPRPSF